MIRLALLCALLVAGEAAAGDRFIIVQSTTSTRNSGLFDRILPIFRARTGIEARIVAVGTGQAIRNAARGDGDVLLVHDRAAEEKFVADGHGTARFDAMYNDFVIVGPPADPAGVAGDAGRRRRPGLDRPGAGGLRLARRRQRHPQGGAAALARGRDRRPGAFRRAGTARPAPAWGRPSTPGSAWAPTC